MAKEKETYRTYAGYSQAMYVTSNTCRPAHCIFADIIRHKTSIFSFFAAFGSRVRVCGFTTHTRGTEIQKKLTKSNCSCTLIPHLTIHIKVCVCQFRVAWPLLVHVSTQMIPKLPKLALFLAFFFTCYLRVITHNTHPILSETAMISIPIWNELKDYKLI